MKQIGYYNGEIGNINEIKCPILDRGLYFGDGCYDATMVRDGHVFMLDAHIDRFFNSARLLRIDLGFDREWLITEINKIISHFDGQQAILYWQATRGTAMRAHAFPDSEVKPNLMMFLCEKDITPRSCEHSAITVEDTRFLHCNIKTLNLLPNVLATQKAVEAGVDEVVFVRDGYVTEMAHSNVSFLKDGVFIYHPFDNKILPGISLKNIIAACEQLGIKSQAKALTLCEALNADELISSSSSAFCSRIVKLDNINVGGRDISTFEKIQNYVYDQYLNSNN